MQWPPWSSNSDRDSNDKRPQVSWSDKLTATDWSHYKDPRNIIPIVICTTGLLVTARLYRSYLRRIPEATYIRPGFFRKRSLFGTVTRVGDADNFHLFHTPGGRLAGWGWAPGRKIPEEKRLLKNNTVCTSSVLIYVIRANWYVRYTSASLALTRPRERISGSPPNHTPTKPWNGSKTTS